MGSSRIDLKDDLVTIMSKMSDGNPGALTVLMRLMKESQKIDPDAAMGPFAHILDLDSFEIYGSHIWIMYKDICGEDIVNFITMLRVIQMGILHRYKLINAINDIEKHIFDKPKAFDIPELLVKLKEQLPNFAKG